MTTPFDYAISRGSAVSGYRLSIEGLPVDFVTLSGMERLAGDEDSAGRTRRVGLSLRDAKISQKIDQVNAKIEASGLTFVIADSNGVASSLFARTPTETWLADDISDSDGTMEVLSISGFSTTGYVWVDSEVMYHSGASAGPPAVFSGLVRGCFDTLAQYHYSSGGGVGDADTPRRLPSVTDGPVTIAGRRVRLYQYVRGDDLQGDGTQIWLGIATGDPDLQGPSWTFSADPISRVLDQELGADLGDPVTPRGISYGYLARPPGFGGAWRSFYAEVIRTAYTSGSSTVIPSFSPGVTIAGVIQFPHDDFVHSGNPSGGFFETQEGNLSDAEIATLVGSGPPYTTTDFLDAINIQAYQLTSSWNTKVRAQPQADGRFRWVYDASSTATPDGVRVGMNIGGSGTTYSTATQSPIDAAYGGTSDNPDAVEWSPDDNVASMAAGQVIYGPPMPGTAVFAAGIPGASQVPRGVFGYDASRDLYLGGSLTPTANMTAVQVEWRDPGATDATTVEYDVSSYDASLRSFTVDRADFPTADAGVGVYHRFTPSNLPQIKFGRVYGTTEEGTYTLLSAIESGAPEFVNLRLVPMLQAGDWDSTEWQAAYADAPELAKRRRYTSFKAVKLRDLITPDLQLGGFYPSFTSSGALTIKRIRHAALTEVADFDITPGQNLITDQGLPSWQKTAFGSLNTVTIQEGYDPIEDKWTGIPIEVRDVAAFGRDPLAKVLTIKPKSLFLGDTVLLSDAVDECAARVLGTYGAPYAIVGCTLNLSAFLLAPGSVVSLSTGLLPDSSGVRGAAGGMERAKAILVSREIDINAGRIDVDLLVALSPTSGYAAAAKASSQSGSGTSWAFTLASSYFASGEDAADHFQAGDLVYVYRWDSTTASTQAVGVHGV